MGHKRCFADVGYKSVHHPITDMVGARRNRPKAPKGDQVRRSKLQLFDHPAGTSEQTASDPGLYCA